MDSVRYLRALRRSWWVVVAAVLVAVAVGAVVFWRTTPVYSTAVQVLANTAGQTAQDDDDPGSAGSSTYIAEQAQTYAQIAPTPPAVADAATAAGYPGANPTVTASANGTDPFILIAVSDTDPEVARAVANAFPETLPGTTTRLSGELPVAVSLAVLSPAALPASPTSPILSRYLLLSAAIGFVVGIGLALGRGYLDRTIRGAEDLEATLELPVLTTVPTELGQDRVPTETHPRSARAEAYRQIRTSLQNLHPVAAGAGPDAEPVDAPTVLLVTSAASGEGKTSTAVNLAVALRQAGQRVAIVDADLRRPQVANSLGVDTSVGLAHVLAGSATLADAAHVDTSGAGVLTVLGAGSIPDNPSEALGSPAMLATIEALRRDHDVVVVDSPPVIPVTDALVLAPHVDAVVLVVRLGLVRRERIRRARTVIERVGGRIVGVVANGADVSRDRYYRYAYAYQGAAPSMSVDLGAALARRDAAATAAGDTATAPAPASEPAADPEPAAEPDSAGEPDSTGEPGSTGEPDSAGEPDSTGEPEPATAQAPAGEPERATAQASAAVPVVAPAPAAPVLGVRAVPGVVPRRPRRPATTVRTDPRPDTPAAQNPAAPIPAAPTPAVETPAAADDTPRPRPAPAKLTPARPGSAAADGTARRRSR